MQHLDGADVIAEALVTEQLIAVAYPFLKREPDLQPTPETALALAQRLLDNGHTREAARTLIYAFFALRDWHLANDAALLCLMLGHAGEGLRLYEAALSLTANPKRREAILQQAQGFAQAGEIVLPPTLRSGAHAHAVIP